MVCGAGEDRDRAGEPVTRADRFGPKIRNLRADGTNGSTTQVGLRLTPAELASLDAQALPGEKRPDTIRRLILGGNRAAKVG